MGRAHDRNPAFWLALPDTRAWPAGDVARLRILSGSVYVGDRRVYAYDARLDPRTFDHGESAARAVARAETMARRARAWIAAEGLPRWAQAVEMAVA